MKISSYAGLIFAAGLLLLSGCKPDVPREIIRVDAIPPLTYEPGVTHIVRRGTEIIWEGPNAFALMFEDSAQQCKGLQPNADGFYITPEPSSSEKNRHYKYKIDCKLDNIDSSHPNLSYSLYSTPPPKQTIRSSTHCQGCAQGTDPDAGQ